MPVLLAVAVGGALGSIARYGVDALIERRSFSVFPWSTFAINATGCLLIGVVIAALVDRHHTPAWVRAGLVMGVLGGYTTFSTFAQEGSPSSRRAGARSLSPTCWGACSQAWSPSTPAHASAACCSPRKKAPCRPVLLAQAGVSRRATCHTQASTGGSAGSRSGSH